MNKINKMKNVGKSVSHSPGQGEEELGQLEADARPWLVMPPTEPTPDMDIAVIPIELEPAEYIEDIETGIPKLGESPGMAAPIPAEQQEDIGELSGCVPMPLMWELVKEVIECEEKGWVLGLT